MKIIILLSNIFGVALCYSWSHQQPARDTPEVAAAKAKHFAAHAKAKQSVSSEGNWNHYHDHDDGSWKNHYDHSRNHHSAFSHHEDSDRKWTGPVALPPGYNKHGAPLPVEDTSEVAAAKSKHLAAHAKAKHSASSWEAQEHLWNNNYHDDGSWKDDTKQSWNDHNVNHDKKWTGPVALPPGYDKHGAPLPVKDTSEVAAAKSKHLAAHAKARHHGSTWESHDISSYHQQNHDDGSWKDNTQQYWSPQAAASHYSDHNKRWNGPVALPPGYDKHGAPLAVHDTPEVAAEKSKHFHLYAQAAFHSAAPRA